MSLSSDMVLFSPSEYPHWRYISTANVQSTSTMLACIQQFMRRYTLLPEKEKVILSEACKDAMMAGFVFSVSNIEGEGLDSLAETRELLDKFSCESSSLQSIDANETSGDSTKRRSTLNMLAATHIALCRDAVPQPILDTSFIKNLHAALFNNTEEWYEAGKYRKCSAFTIMSTHEKLTYLSYHKIPRELNRLVECTNRLLADIFNSKGTEEEKISSLVKLGGAFFIQFEAIHPFHDGNGRVGRLLLAYMLSSLTPFGVNSFYMESEWFPVFVDKSIYLQCFENETRDPSEITALIIEGIYVAWKNYFTGSD